MVSNMTAGATYTPIATTANLTAPYPTGSNGTVTPTSSGGRMVAGATSTNIVPCPNGAQSRLSGSAFGLLFVGGMALVRVCF